MSREKIEIKKTKDALHFYLIMDRRSYYLFTQKFTKDVYRYFRYQKTMNELRAFHRWDRNPRLNKTIEKIPLYIKYVKKEMM
ncbi:MAG TPA: hypothetical protein IAB48_09675 [Candidatus Fimimorpha excrementavium]|nr:hypothetical protein [Candidatus Fimimorpha excrementavium]